MKILGPLIHNCKNRGGGGGGFKKQLKFLQTNSVFWFKITFWIYYFVVKNYQLVFRSKRAGFFFFVIDSKFKIYIFFLLITKLFPEKELRVIIGKLNDKI